MSDGVPSEEQRRRIEHGVLDRIEARRRRVRGIASGAAAVALLAGGIGGIGVLATSVHSGSSTGGAASSAGGSRTLSGEGSSAGDGPAVRVTCALAAGSDAGGRRIVTVRADALPAAAVQACGGTPERGGFSAADGPATPGSSTITESDVPSAPPEATSPPPPAALCVDVDGGLVVIARTGTSEQACTRAGLRLWER